MESYLISTMVQEHQPQPQSKKLHPFFSKDIANTPDPQPSATAAPHDDERSQTPINHDGAQDDRRKRRRIDDAGSPGAAGASPTVAAAAAPMQHPEDCSTSGIHPDAPSIKQQPVAVNEESSKEYAEGNKSDAVSALTLLQPTTDTKPVEPVSQPEPSDESKAADASESRKPRKVLKFNLRTGTLGSPPKPKSIPKPSRVVCMKYGSDSDDTKQRIGTTISQILDGSLQLPVTPPKKRARRGRPKKPEQSEGQREPAPPAHPFFGGKPKAQPAPAKPQEATRPSSKPRHTVFMTTPVSPRKARAPFDPSKVAHFGSQKAGITKVPGAMHAMWPPQGMSHVHGDEDSSTSFVLSDQVEPPRKSKGQVVSISRDESVLNLVVNNLNIDNVRAGLHEEVAFPTPVPSELRLPRRHFESGRKLRARIDPQLKSTRALREDQYLDELSDQPDTTCHPAIASLYRSLETRLSAYDRSTCEGLAWTQKYAPSSAAEVLQSSREGPLLKEWLEALRVQSVDTGSSNTEAKGNGKQEKPPKRRKKNKLEGFIVDSDDEADELNGISEDDDEDSSSEAVPSNKTVIRNGSRDLKDAGRFKNAVLISGPHGCGKTAAVYAVAKELDYEVFEINSSSRRSGKDLMEKVGDMTRNHLVQQHRAEKATSGVAEDEDDTTADDVRSGKQGTMTSFFKPKATAPVKTKQPKKASDKSEEPAKTSTPKAQKQSLILVEEVDVLYKEDSQFWATLMTMISQSKRPFIFTCNDEGLVPAQSLPLHGIFRFTPPPTDLAVDLCLLVAANEGHALQRHAVEAAYASRRDDLRATLLDLNYWCQLGVGDRRGGFDWFLLRWPRGCDLDEKGDTIRVVSEDTYSKGAGWIGRDPIISDDKTLSRDEEVMHQLWNLWQVPVGDWQQSLDLEPWARDISAPSLNASSRFDALAAYDDFCEAMSISDLCSDGRFGSPHQQRIDATLPDLPTKMRDDYIVGRQLLEAELICSPACPSAPLSQALASLARESLLHRTEDACISGAATVLNPLTESSAISVLDASFQPEPKALTRYDIALAFDPLAISDKALINSLDPSVFDRTLRLIVLDVAPYVRGITAYDNRLMQERTKLSSLLSEGGNGKGKKRMRTTRAAMSALEGGERRSTRGERWFKGVGSGLVMRTGGDGWAEAARAEFEAQAHLLAPIEESRVDVEMEMEE